MNFATYLTQALYAKDITANTFSKLLVGTKISRTSFYEYLRGTTVPSFEKAYQIMKIIDIPFTSEELIDILNQSIPESVLSQKLTGSYKIYFSDLGVSEEELKYRVSQVSTGMNDYIKKLIKKDLECEILKKGEDYE